MLRHITQYSHSSISSMSATNILSVCSVRSYIVRESVLFLSFQYYMKCEFVFFVFFFGLIICIVVVSTELGILYLFDVTTIHLKNDLCYYYNHAFINRWWRFVAVHHCSSRPVIFSVPGLWLHVTRWHEVDRLESKIRNSITCGSGTLRKHGYGCWNDDEAYKITFSTRCNLRRQNMDVGSLLWRKSLDLSRRK